MIKRIISVIFIFAILVVTLFGMTIPKGRSFYQIDSKGDALLQEITENDISLFHNCKLDDGKITVTGGDPYIIFSGLNTDCKSAVLIFKEKTDDMEFQIYFDCGEGFSEENSIRLGVYKEDAEVVFPVQYERISQLRIDIDQDYCFSSVELHSSEPVRVITDADYSFTTALLCVGASLLVAVCVFFLDVQFRFFDKLFCFLKKRRVFILKLFLSVAVCGVLAALAELVTSGIVSSSLGAFNFYRFVFICGCTFCAAVFVLFAKQLAKKPENAFLCLSLTLCVLMVILCPFGHVSWDVDSHYNWTLNASYLGNTSYITQADVIVKSVQPDYWPSQEAEVNSQHIQVMNESYMVPMYKKTGTNSIAHIPAGLFMAIGRFFHMSFYAMTTFSKLGNALFYCLICFFGIRKLKSGKMIAAVVALIPTSLFLASNFSYDYWVNCLVILGMAYFVSAHQEPDKQISLKDTIIMCSAFMLASLPKLIYAVLLLIPFFMKRTKIKDKKYYLICLLSIVALIVLLGIKSLSVIRKGGDLRGGSNVSTVGQIQFMLQNMQYSFTVLLKFLMNYLSVPEMTGYITNFAYAGMGTGSIVYMILMPFVALTDKNIHDVKAYGIPSKIAVVCLYFGTSALVAIALYICFTPVGLGTVNGCQPRYILPLLYPLLSIIGIGFHNKINRTVYHSAILAVCVVTTLVNIGTVMLPCWIG